MKPMRLSCLLAAASLMLLLTGCWDREEIDERTSVVAMAIDKAKDLPGRLRLSIQIPISKRIAGAGAAKSSGGGKEAVIVMSSTGYTLAEATRNLQKRLNRELFLGHTRVVAISEEVAREEGLDTVIDALRRTPQIRRLLWPVIVKGEALRVLTSNPKLEQIPIMFLMDLLTNNSKMETIPDMTLGTFFINLSDSSREPGMNIVQATKDEIKWVGLAVFKESKMVAELSPQEVVPLLQIRDEKKGGIMSVPCEKNSKLQVSYLPKSITTKKQIVTVRGKKTVQVQVTLEGDIMESQCRIDFTKQENIKKYQQLFEKSMEERAVKLVTKVQKELKQDVFGFGTLDRAHSRHWSHEKWKKEFLSLKTTVRYDVLIRRTGMEVWTK
ncbi:Ger(x)C family spore germination protein [Brevibacillus fluminis]|uniref:Ger(x)C family spore germination protein n=1 Tax=Brevibacillus fluminis TaxID=511487 RepID=UPI003F8B100C